MNTDPITHTITRFFIWSGAAAMVLCLVGLVLLMPFVPPPRPTWSAQQIAEIYVANQKGILFGALFWTVGCVLWGLWQAAVIAQCRHIERRSPAVMHGLVILASTNLAIFVLCGVTVGIAGFRPDDVLPDITRLLNDAFWFLVLFSWPPFAAWMILVAVAVFSDERAIPAFPRWVGYLNLWCALLMIPGGTIAFFKFGPFAYDGLMSFYVLAAAFDIWVIAMAVAMNNAIAREERVTASKAHASIVVDARAVAR